MGSVQYSFLCTQKLIQTLEKHSNEWCDVTFIKKNKNIKKTARVCPTQTYIRFSNSHNVWSNVVPTASVHHCLTLLQMDNTKQKLRPSCIQCSYDLTVLLIWHFQKRQEQKIKNSFITVGSDRKALKMDENRFLCIVILSRSQRGPGCCRQ